MFLSRVTFTLLKKNTCVTKHFFFTAPMKTLLYLFKDAQYKYSHVIVCNFHFYCFTTKYRKNIHSVISRMVMVWGEGSETVSAKVKDLTVSLMITHLFVLLVCIWVTHSFTSKMNGNVTLFWDYLFVFVVAAASLSRYNTIHIIKGTVFTGCL